MRSRMLGLCLPPVLFALLDGSLTLAGQSPLYLAGSYRDVNEASPTFHYLLTVHPLAFVAGILIWMGMVVGIILLLPDTLALIVSIAVTLGHAVGSATWLYGRFEFSYQACNGLLLLTAVTLGIGIRWGWRAKPVNYQPPVRSSALRWLFIALLFGGGVYLFLWPRNSSTN